MNNYLRQIQGYQPETGKKVKNYIYHYADMIGRGNFAKVYKGLNLQTSINSLTQDEIVAIKLISLDELKSKHLESLVFQEIRVLQQFNHPNILRFIEAMLSQRNCYIVTELCSEGSLDDRIKTRVPFSDQELGTVILDIWKGLKYMKEKGVAHRDLKPANIFISKGRMKIADFGLAKFYTERFHDLDIGSPQYMSPEGMILNCYSEKTDIWSFGIIVYELLHGQTPFIFCKDENEMKYFISRPVPESRWRKDVNPLLRRFVDRMLEVDEYRRPNVYELASQPYLKALLERQDENYSNGRLYASSWQGYAQGQVGSLGNIKIQESPSQYQTNNLTPSWRPGIMQESLPSPKSKSMNHKISLNGSSPTKNLFPQNNMFIPPSTLKQQGYREHTKYSFNKKEGIDPVVKETLVRNNIPMMPNVRAASNESPQRGMNYAVGQPLSPELMYCFRNSNPPLSANLLQMPSHQRQISSTTLQTNESQDERRSPHRLYLVKRSS